MSRILILRPGAIFLLSKLAKEKVAVVWAATAVMNCLAVIHGIIIAISSLQKMPRVLRYLVKCGIEVAGKDGLAEKLSLPPDAERVAALLA